MKIRIPGKIMLSGEYAVLFGADALAVTVNNYLRIEAHYSNTPYHQITSDLWPETLTIDPSHPTSITPQQKPIVEALLRSQKLFQNPNLKISVHSNLNPTAGLGTSSAVLLATCLASYLSVPGNSKASERTFFDPAQLAYNIQKSLQGSASGYDVLTQLLGGLVRMTPAMDWPGQWKQTKDIGPTFESFVHIYVGKKGAPTTPTLNETLAWLRLGDRKRDLIRVSSRLTEACSRLLTSPNAENFTKLLEMNVEHREFFAKSPCYPSHLANGLRDLAACDQTWSFKTTGAGGEDAILLFGEKANLALPERYLKDAGWQPLRCSFMPNGVVVE